VESIPQNQITVESVRKIVSKVVDEVVDKLNDENVSDYSYSVSSVDVVFEDNATITIEINIDYTVKFYEVSEAVSAMLEYAIGTSDEQPSDEELERLFNEAYENELQEINSDYAIQLYMRAVLDLRSYYIGGGELEVDTTPITCDGDYCDVGLGITIRLRKIPVERFINAINDVKESIKAIVERVAEFHRI
jgi:uncharacterized protein YlzI (FlbEa/FlbD family)